MIACARIIIYVYRKQNVVCLCKLFTTELIIKQNCFLFISFKNIYYNTFINDYFQKIKTYCCTEVINYDFLFCNFDKFYVETMK